MPVTTAKADGEVVVALEGDVTITEAALAQQELQHALAAADAVLVDLQGVTSVDTAVLQVLIAAHRAARRAGKRLRLSNSGGPVNQAVTELGLQASEPFAVRDGG